MTDSVSGKKLESCKVSCGKSAARKFSERFIGFGIHIRDSFGRRVVGEDM